ncbi:MAG: hypothetical protein ACLPZM_00135 [Thermoplasmata archaeon]
MGTRRTHALSARPDPTGPWIVLAVCALTMLGIATATPALGHTRFGGALPAIASPQPQNGSSGSDPTSSASGDLCPGSGPVILGVEWTCVAVLDLTELLLILVSIGIVAYVFRGSDRAELPGDSAEVPMTAEEWEVFQRARKGGLPYPPPPPESEPEER